MLDTLDVWPLAMAAGNPRILFAGTYGNNVWQHGYTVPPTLTVTPTFVPTPIDGSPVQTLFPVILNVDPAQ
jgi:hypothetical protein